MFQKFVYLKPKNISSSNDINYFLIFLAFFVCLSGFLGPRFWDINSPNFKFFLSEIDLGNSQININKLEKLKLNKNYLSSDQLNNKIAVLEWSKQILKKAKNKTPLPRMYFNNIPREIKQFETKERKDVFLSILLPIALRGNELVSSERKLMKIAFATNNIYKIEHFAKKYNVKNYKEINFSSLNSLQIKIIKEELMLKINQIPVSMILAQAIIESGWGSSRFAIEGNALFGEWTWKNDYGIKPKGNLDAKFAVKKFKTISDSLNSYILNLNSHFAYKEMRIYRALMHKTGRSVKGIDTANYLKNYAEIGAKYIKKVKNMIKGNNLNEFENSKLERYVN